MSNPIRLDDLLSGGQRPAAQSPTEGAIRLDDLLGPATPATPSVDAGALAANVRARAPGIPGFGSDVTAAPPRTAEERTAASTPPLPVRVAQGVGQFGKELVTHPLPTIGHMIADPLISAERTFLRPVQGERVTATQYLRGKSGPVPGSLPPGTIITAENSPSSITPKEFRNAALQTTAVAATAPLSTVASKATEGGLMALLTGRTAGTVDEAAVKALASRVGHAAGVAPVGAAYSPEDPLTGAATLATLGPLLEPVAQRAGKVAAPLARGARELGGRIREPLNPLSAAGIEEATSAPLERRTLVERRQVVTAVPTERRTLRRRLAETIDPSIVRQIAEAEQNPVTGLPGRGPFDRALPAVEANPALSVVRGDFNGTKALNDTMGHPYTDAEFRRVAAAMQQAAEELGIQPLNFHPPGGDEFLSIVPTDKAEAFTRRAAELYGVREHAPGVKSSISFGYGPTEVDADAAAYAAKRRDKAAQGIPNRDQAPSAPAATGAVRIELLENIDVEPERFQFKQDVDRQTGAGRALKGTDRFNPDLAGVVAVWRDPADGRLKIVNGHHRYDLAKRAGVRELAVREIQAPTPEKARSIGAMINIAEERGTPLDVAKLIRDTGMTREEMADSGIAVGNALAEKGAALAKLDRTVFDRVAKGEIPEDVGVGVGNVLDRPEQQRAAVDLIQRSGKRLTRAEAENVARQVRDAGSESVTQETLFGTEETALSLAVDRARLAEALKKDLTRDSRLFGFVSREGRAEELSRAGNTINVEESARLAQESAGAAELFDRLASRAGPIGDILTQGARRLAHGERLAAVKSDIAPRLRAAIQEALAGGEGRGVAGSAADLGRDAPARGAATGEVADPDQAALFGEQPEPITAAAMPRGELTAGEGLPIALDDLLGEAQQPRLLEARDLFGNETPEGPAQGSMFGEQAGTAASRSLRETEAAARAEIPGLRTILSQTTDPAVRAKTAQRLAQLERLVNRGEKITADELVTRAAAGESERMAAADRTPRVRGPEDEAPQLFEATTVPPTAPGTGGAAAPALTRPPVLAPHAPTGLARYTDALRRLFSVATRTPESMRTALSIREHAARRALEDERAMESLRTFAKQFDKMPDAERLDFIDRIESGQKQRTIELQEAANVMRDLLDEARDAIRALGTGKLEHFIEDYFPHIWEDPAKARQVIQRIESKRSLTGPGSFLKQRSIPTIKEGIAAGLTPLTTNPIDLVMLKLKEMHRYLMGQRIMEEMKSEGLARFVSSFEQPPEGYRAIDDKVGTVYGPPAVTMTETFDKLVVEKMQQIMKRLGIDHVRKPKIGGTRAGYYEMGGNKLVTRAGGTEQVIFHEFGHALDDRYGLWDRLIDPTNKSKAAIADRKVIQAELRALADLRFEGQQADPTYQRYVRNRYEKIANAVAALIYAPEKMRSVAPTVMARLTGILRAHPEVADVLDIKPSLVLGSASHEIPVGGLVVKGRYYAPEPVATVLNNFLSPGLRGNPFFDAYMGLGNVMNQAQLGLSAFHLGFTSMDAAVSKAALGIEQLAAGRPVSGLVSLARTPIAPVENYLRGSKVLREYLRPGTQGGDLAAVVDGLVQGGGRVRMDTFYKNSSVESFWKALSDAKRAYLQPVSARSLGRAGAATAAIPWKGLGATLEVAAKPILEHIVPRQKLGVFADLARFELSRLPKNASPELVRDTMARAWDSVDNRMGQLVYDNLFWHRALKDLSMASVRSVGWNLGTLREIGGGVLDVGRVPGRLLRGDRAALTHRMAYIAALPVVAGLAGAVLNYLYTGQAPETLKDYFYPRTGRKNADGTDERVQLPSYMKDIFAYAHHPYETVKHKLHPAVATIADMLENADFFGDQIRNPDDPLVQQIQQEADYMVQQFEPFGVSNMREELGRGQPLSRTLPNFVGVTPAPREAVRSPAVNRMGELLRHRMPTGATREQADERHRRSNLISRLRQEPEEGMAALWGGAAEGSLSGRSARNITRTALTPASVNSFKRLTAREALEVYEIASPEERRLWLPALADKLDRLDGALLTPAEVDDIMARIRRLSAAGAFNAPPQAVAR